MRFLVEPAACTPIASSGRGEELLQAALRQQPRLEVAVNVKHEDEILVLKIAAKRRMVTNTRSEDCLAAEVDDEAAVLIVCLPKSVAESLRREGT